MKGIYRNLVISGILSLGLGVLSIMPVVLSENGYVAGYVYLPLLILIFLVAAILFLVGFGLIAASKKAGPYILLSSILIPVGFFGGAFVFKYFEVGAYRVEPMIPFSVN